MRLSDEQKRQVIAALCCAYSELRGEPGLDFISQYPPELLLDLAQTLNDTLEEKWRGLWGLEVPLKEG